MQNQPASAPTVSIAQIHRNAKFRLTVLSFGISFFFIFTACLFYNHLWFSIPAMTIAIYLMYRTIVVRKQLCAIEMNGDALIISGSQSSTVTDIKSIRRIRSTKIGRQKITRVSFHLDGDERSVMLLTSLQDSPGRILTELKKKKKADL